MKRLGLVIVFSLACSLAVYHVACERMPDVKQKKVEVGG
jgi:hypothetical protein